MRRPDRRSFPKGCPSSGEETFEVFSEAVEDTGFGLADRIGAQSQGGPDLGRVLSLDRGAPERLPGLFVVLAPDQVEGPVQQGARRLSTGRVFLIQVRRGSIGQPLPSLGAPLRLGAILTAAKMIADLVAGDDAQPAAEGVA